MPRHFVRDAEQGSRSKVPASGPTGSRAARAGVRKSARPRAVPGQLRAPGDGLWSEQTSRTIAPGGPMTRADKEAAVAELVDSFQGSSAAVLTEYRGLSVKQLQDLRRALGESATYAVVKNTLTQTAAKQAGVEGVQEMLLGPTAIAFVKGDVVEAAKGRRYFAKANPALIVQGGCFEVKSLDAKEIAKLADLESREVLLAKLAGAMMASLNEAVYLLNAPLAQAARAVGALQTKAEEDPSVIGGAGTPEQPQEP